MKKLISTFSLVCICFGATAQANFTQYQLNNTTQAQYLNPAFRSASKVGISIIPFSNLINLQFLHTGFALDDALATRPDIDSLDLTPAKLVESLNPVNYFDINLRNEFLAVTITGKKLVLILR